MLTDYNYLTLHIVRHAESTANQARNYNNNSIFGLIKSACTSLQYEPNLTFNGIQQAIDLGNDFLKNNEYDCYFCSCTTRTLMTSLFSLRGKNVKIYPIQYISEFKNIMGNFDNSNIPLTSDKLKSNELIIRNWINSNWNYYFIDSDLTKLLTEIYDNSNTHISSIVRNILDSKKECDNENEFYLIVESRKQLYGTLLTELHNNFLGNKYYKLLQNLLECQLPIIDYSIMDYIENLYGHITEPNIDFFKNYILENLSDFNKICIFTHGQFTKKFIKSYHGDTRDLEFKNTQVTELNISRLNMKMINFCIIYFPIYRYTNDYNISKREGIKGVLNIGNNWFFTKLFYKDLNINTSSPDTRFYFNSLIDL